MLQLNGALGFSSRIAAAGLTVCCILLPSVASATGTINIQHKDGTVNTYRDVEIKVFSGSLFLTSDDGDGTIVVTRAACSYREKIIVCLPTTAALVQEGESNRAQSQNRHDLSETTRTPINRYRIRRRNFPPIALMLTLSTENGTFINVRGRIDQLIKQ